MLDLKAHLKDHFIREDDIVFSYAGPFSDHLLKEMTSDIEGKLSSLLNEKDFHNILPIFVEQVQNVIRYSSARGQENFHEDQKVGIGLVIVSKDGDAYKITSANPIDKGVAMRLNDMLNQLSQKDKSELKILYKERLRKGPDDHSLGAGLGFLEMFRKAKMPINHLISEITPSECLFSYAVTI
jgi:hypothetical protein